MDVCSEAINILVWLEFLHITLEAFISDISAITSAPNWWRIFLAIQLLDPVLK